MQTPSSDERIAVPAASDQLTTRLAEDMRSFIGHHRWPIGGAVVAGLLAHGVALTNPSLSLDEPLHVVTPGITGISIGRPTMALVKAVTQDLMPLPLWNTALALILLLVAGGTFAFLLMRAAQRPVDHRATVAIFLVVFVTLPLAAYWLMWGESAIAYGFGLLLAAVAALFGWLWVAEGWGRNAALASAAVAFFVVTTYQSQLFVALAGVLAANVAYEVQEGRSAVALRERAAFSLRLLAPIVAGGSAGTIVTARLVWDGDQGSGYLQASSRGGRPTPSRSCVTWPSRCWTMRRARASSAAGSSSRRFCWPRRSCCG